MLSSVAPLELRADDLRERSRQLVDFLLDVAEAHLDSLEALLGSALPSLGPALPSFGPGLPSFGPGLPSFGAGLKIQQIAMDVPQNLQITVDSVIDQSGPMLSLFGLPAAEAILPYRFQVPA